MKLSIKITKIALFGLMIMVSCGKGFLEEKYASNQNIPATLQDVEAILNAIDYTSRPARELGIIGADEYYVTPIRHASSITPYMKNGYIWAEEVYEGFDIYDWVWAYQRILYANLALETLEKVNVQSVLASHLKGVALFHRANNHYQLAQLFCRPYGEIPEDPLGLPLRLEVDVSISVKRSTLQETYNQILSDLHLATDLINVDFSHPMQVSKAAVYALLSRLSLLMGNYQKVVEYSDLVLNIKSELVDFNKLETTNRYTFLQDYGVSHPEVIWYEDLVATQFLSNSSSLNMDTVLYNSYSKYDARRELYFFTENDGRVTFKGSYSGFKNFFVGIAVDEVYLNKSEAQARLNLLQEGRSTLENLLKNRYHSEGLPEYRTLSITDLLALILDERKKELVFRGLRWEDLRRFNLDADTKTTLKRELGDVEYFLNPREPGYTWPLPQNEVEIGRLIQNPR